MKIGPKYKIARRLGPEVFEKTQTQKYQLNADKKAKSARRGRRSRPSDFGRQLIEKQKVRFTYGVSEKQFVRYVQDAVSQKTIKPVDALYIGLERRLDNVVYRLGLAGTRAFARQLVSHGHIEVNGKRLTVPSYSVSEGDVIRIRERSVSKAPFENLTEKLANRPSSKWLVYDANKNEGKVTGNPRIEDSFGILDFSTVIEFYSR